MSAYEAVLKELGSFGPFQRRVFILVSMFETPAAWAMLLPVLLNNVPSWTCIFNEGQSSQLTTNSLGYNQTTNQSSVDFVGNNSTMKCQAVDAGMCKEIKFMDDFTSVISEVCLIATFNIFISKFSL